MIKTKTSANPKIKHKARAKARAERVPFLFPFPGEGEETLPIVSCAYAFNSAYVIYAQAQDTNKTLPLDRVPKPLMDTLITEGVRIYSTILVDGRQGTNDPGAFFKTFRSFFPRAFLAMFALLQQEDWLSPHLATFTEPHDLTTECHRAVMANLSSILATPADQPLSIVWPELEEVQDGSR